MASPRSAGGPAAPELVSPPRARRRARLFQAYLFLATAGFLILAALARVTPYFSVDLVVARALQAVDLPGFAGLMYGVSWIGFMPQAAWIGLAVVAALLLARLRREAALAFLAGSSSIVVAVVKFIVHRPRPTPDLVRVLAELDSPSFPSGHVVVATAFGGYLLFLAFTLLRPSWGRSALMTAMATIVLLMGPSRVFLGQHWPSDVAGAYVVGTLWLALTIALYRRGAGRASRDPR